MNPPQLSCVRLRCGSLGLFQGGLCLLHMYPSYIAPPLPHQEGMIVRPEFGRFAERHGKVPGDHAGRCPIRPRGPSWVWEGNLDLFDRQTSDRPPGYLCCAHLKEGREEDVLQRIFHHLEGHTNVLGDAFHKGPLLMEELLQAYVCSLRVLMRHPGQGGH